MLEKIKSLSEKYFSETQSYRHHIHSNPELSFQEYETSAYIQSQLKHLGINFEVKADTGIVAHVFGKNANKKVVALRADIDALPIQETNEVPYKSKNAGVMHACGHDVHTSSLLTSLKILNETKAEWEGTVKAIFQPAEEKLPGGASIMIKEGALENPKASSIVGQHVMPLIEAGKVGFRSGKYMASTDELYIKVIGKGGHGAMPHLNIDPVLIASHMIVALQQVVSRNADPKLPSVLSFGKVIANGATNVIPNEVYIEGTFRTLDEEWRAKAHEHIKKIASGVVESMGGKLELEIRKGYPYLINDEAVTMRARGAAEEYLGKENVLDLDIWMAAEDFAYYSQVLPASFYRLGTGNIAKGITASVHTPNFNIDEESLKIAPGLMAWIAVKELEGK
jgi:amidohydrolase